MDRPLLIYDGDCGFCKRWVLRFRAWTRGGFDFRPYQEAAADFPDIPESDFQKAAQWVDADSHRESGAAAMLNALASGHGPRWPLWLYTRVPVLRFLINLTYRFIAQNRTFFSALDRMLYGEQIEPARFDAGCSLFGRGLSLCFAIAFGSLWLQLSGLFGPHGIVPIRDYLFRADTILGSSGFWQVPSVFWVNSDIQILHLACGLGLAISLLTLAGFARGPGFLLAWVLYLSFCSVGAPFLNFQWDNLLLECGLLAAFLFSWSFKSKTRRPPHFLIRWLLIFLLFRLMFSSGVVKLSSGDPMWIGLTALDYHFWTQPLPTPLAWWVSQLPDFFLAASTGILFFLELAVPFLFFLPGRARLCGALATIGLQIAILLTGNYGFFNLLTIALCFLLIDDRSWRSLRIGKFSLFSSVPSVPAPVPATTPPPANRRPLHCHLVPILLSVAVLFMTTLQWFGIFRVSVQWPKPIQNAYGAVSSFRSINSYGLFATMTTRRLELIVQGSADGANWETYEFKWKPDRADDPLPWAAPHMPRLDWQMWFAALDSPRSNRLAWLQRFCGKLLDGEPVVVDLLESNPFPNRPPRQVRIIAREFQFSRLGERDSGQVIWETGERKIF